MRAGPRFAGGHRRQCHREPARDPVHNRGKGMAEQFFAAGKVVPDGAHGEAGFVCHLPQRRTLEAVDGDDPEDRFNDFCAPGFGINNFRHPYYLAHLC